MSSPSNIIRSTIDDLPADTGQTLCFIGLGANLDSVNGSPQQTLLAAFNALTNLSQYPIIVSSLWQTTPLDCPPDSPVFTNAVAALLSPHGEEPLVLLKKLQQLEQKFGRVRTGVQNAPRALDLDLLICGDVIMATEKLTLPHPRMTSRRFVLVPLAEIAPDYVPLGQNSGIEELLSVVQNQGELQHINVADPL